MNFKESQPIFVQIAERLSDEILAGTYLPDGRVPGVREYSALLEVNANTAVKSYDLLAQRGVLYNKRGLGYFVAPDARRLILDARRAEFFGSYLPDLLRRMRQLGVTPADVARAWDETADDAPAASTEENR